MRRLRHILLCFTIGATCLVGLGCEDDVQVPEPVMTGRWDVVLNIYGAEPASWQLVETAEELTGLGTVRGAALWPAYGWADRNGAFALEMGATTGDTLYYEGNTSAVRDSAWGSVQHIRRDTTVTGTFTARRR